MGEMRDLTLIQAAALSGDFEKKLAAIVGKPPETIGIAIESQGLTIMKTGPRAFWLIGAGASGLCPQLAGFCAVTPLSHSRTRIFLEGAPARDVLAKGIPLDFHASAFTPGMFAQTGLHHMPVLVHCVSGNRFELYALRTFAVSVWEWLSDAALEFVE
jgi:heterotetrameric sarcosine oxidase gamma subunit